MRALVLNAGSSSLKFAVYEGDRAQALAPLLKGGFDRIGVDGTCWTIKHVVSGAVLVDREPARARCRSHARRLYGHAARKLDALNVTIDCAGHRVVHGGDVFSCPVEISPTVMKNSRRWPRSRPCISPTTLQAYARCRRWRPAFRRSRASTQAFHLTQPHIQRIYALPRRS